MFGIEPVLAEIRAQPREGDRIFLPPVAVFEVTDVQCREERFGAPVFEADQVADADLVHSGFTQPVGRFEPVAVVGFAAAQVVDRIAFAVVGMADVWGWWVGGDGDRFTEKREVLLR